MKDLGYGSHNSILNLGTLALLSVLYYIRLMFYLFVVKPFVYFTKKGGAYMSKLGDCLFYGELLFLTMEAYLEFLIAGYLNLSEPLGTTDGEIGADVLAWYVVMLCLIIIPLLFIYILSRPLEVINKKKFYKKWDGLYEGIKTKEKSTIFFYPVFCVRRIIFCGTAFYMWSTPA